MQLSDITPGTVGGKDWQYKNAAPFGCNFNSSVWPALLYGVPVVPEAEYDGDYGEYLLNQLDKYFMRTALTTDILSSYPRYTIKTYKIAFYDEDPVDKNSVIYLNCYDGEVIRTLTFNDVEVIGEDGKIFVFLRASWSGLGSLTNWDSGAYLNAFTDNIQIFNFGGESIFFNTVPVFNDRDGMEHYLMSSDPDPTHYGGFLSYTDYQYTGTDEEGDSTSNEDILGISEDLGFDLSKGPMRGAVLSDGDLEKLGQKIGEGWAAGNIGEAIIGIKEIRTPGAIDCEEEKIIIPGKTLSPTVVNGKPIIKQFQSFDFGTYNVSEKFNNFLDYTNTSVALYLPYSGLHQLESKTVIGSKISLQCNIDYITGAIIWYVEINRENARQVLYEFNGNCSMDMVLSSIDYGQKISHVLTGLTDITSAIAFPSISTIGDAGKEFTQASLDSYIKVGNISSNFGWTGIQYPFLCFSRSKVKYPDGYKEHFGMPSMKKERLGNLTGYTKIAEIHLDGLECLEEERQELETLLKNGVIL